LTTPGFVCEYDGLESVAQFELGGDVWDMCLHGGLWPPSNGFGCEVL